MSPQLPSPPLTTTNLCPICVFSVVVLTCPSTPPHHKNCLASPSAFFGLCGELISVSGLDCLPFFVMMMMMMEMKVARNSDPCMQERECVCGERKEDSCDRPRKENDGGCLANLPVGVGHIRPLCGRFNFAWVPVCSSSVPCVCASRRKFVPQETCSMGA